MRSTLNWQLHQLFSELKLFPQQPFHFASDFSFLGGVDTSAKGGIIDKFSTGRRRLKENIAQKTGKEAADNSEFEQRSQRVVDLRDKV